MSVVAAGAGDGCELHFLRHLVRNERPMREKSA